ncbi:hypothetical protein [Streptomyces sp. H23]|uniref:hypothetical protein n=1 Tax=Streptomyces sp. H23 TaxID=2541723 RepID=UPI00106E5AC2|nr:hypothetical protein [Streptomyces sp. H23]
MTEPTHTASETTEALMERVRVAVPVLAAHAEATEDRGRIAPESLEAMRETGLYALGTPVGFSGTDVDLVTQVRAL